MRSKEIIAGWKSPNNGSRKLLESIIVPEVMQALTDWAKNSGTGLLIGGLALSYYAIPRYTSDVDLLSLSKSDIPSTVDGFKRSRPGAFLHIKTHVEIKVVAPENINVPVDIASKVFTNYKVDKSGIKIASMDALIALKLHRGSLQDQADILNLYKLGGNISSFALPKEKVELFNKIIAHA